MSLPLQDPDKNKKSNTGSSPLSHKVTSSPHYKLNIRPPTKCTPLSYTSPGLHKDKTKLFEGLDDSVTGNETFVPRTNLKRLILKPRSRNPSPHPLPDSTSPPFTQHSSPLITSTVAMTTSSIPAFTVTNRTTPQSGTPGGSPYNNPIIKPTPL